MSEQAIYEATVRNFLEVSRRYLAILGTTGPALMHQPRSSGGGGYPVRAIHLAPNRALPSFPSITKAEVSHVVR